MSFRPWAMGQLENIRETEAVPTLLWPDHCLGTRHVWLWWLRPPELTEGTFHMLAQETEVYNESVLKISLRIICLYFDVYFIIAKISTKNWTDLTYKSTLNLNSYNPGQVQPFSSLILIFNFLIHTILLIFM